MDQLERLRPVFLTEREARFSPLEALVTFSAKEALFKMLSPMVKEFFGFEAATVGGINGNALTLTLNDPVGCFARGSMFHAFFGFHQDHVVTVCMLE